MAEQTRGMCRGPDGGQSEDRGRAGRREPRSPWEVGSHEGGPGLRSKRIQTEMRTGELGLPPRRRRPGGRHVEQKRDSGASPLRGSVYIEQKQTALICATHLRWCGPRGGGRPTP